MNFFISLISIIISISLCNSQNNVKFLQDYQDYNMYVLSIQLATTLCLSSPKVCKDKMNKVPKNVLTIHGLWPSIVGEKLEDCNTGKQIDIKFDDVDFNNVMEEYWPSLKGADVQFWDHEYNKHGFCWVMKYGKTDPDDFFRMALELYNKKNLDKILLDGDFNITPGTQSFEYQKLRDKFSDVVNHNFDMHCVNHDGLQYLIDIYIYLDLFIS